MIKEEIMHKIKKENIQMRSNFFFYVRKISLQGMAAFFVVAGAVLFNVILFFVKKTKEMNVLFAEFPYGCLLIFFVIVFLANWVMHKFDLSCGMSMNSHMAIFFLVMLMVFLSFFFIHSGIEEVIEHWIKSGLL